LSTYVFVSFLVSAAAVYVSCVGLVTPENEADYTSGKGCESPFLKIVIGFAVINIIFAWFLQNQVWKEIMKHQDEFIDGDTSQTYRGMMPEAALGAFGNMADAAGKAAGREDLVAKAKEASAPADAEKAAGKIVVPKNVTQEAFKKTFLEDFVVLFMFIALLGIFILSRNPGMVDKKGPKCATGMAETVAGLYFWTTVAYSFAYYCCSCCAASVTMKKEQDYDALK